MQQHQRISQGPQLCTQQQLLLCTAPRRLCCTQTVWAAVQLLLLQWQRLERSLNFCLKATAPASYLCCQSRSTPQPQQQQQQQQMLATQNHASRVTTDSSCAQRSAALLLPLHLVSLLR
jgi:hypothetical protein